MTRRRTAAALASDHGPPERAQHVHAEPHAVVIETAEAGSAGQVFATRRRIRPPIECITLSKDEHEAAAMLAAAYRLRDDYDLGVHRVREDAGEGPRIRSNRPPITLPDAVLDALARYRAAMTLMGRCGYVVTRVVCDEIGLDDLARMLGRNRQELTGVLKAGLGTLADAMEGRRG
jgi:uncharacterized protein (DUF58 family)